MLRALLPALAGLLLAPAVRAQEVRHDLGAADFEAWVDGLPAKGQRLVQVSVHAVAGKPVFAGLARPNPAKVAWTARHGLTAADYQKLFDDESRADGRLVSVCGYRAGAEVRFAAVFAREDFGVWKAHSGQSAAQVQATIDDTRRRGLWPSAVGGYPTPDGTRYAVLFTGGSGLAVEARLGLSAADHRKVIADLAKRGRRPAWASAFHDGTGPRFDLLVVQDRTRDWEARCDLTAAQYAALDDRFTREGLRPALVSVYPAGDQSRYLGVWERERPLPITGTAVPALAGFDRAMLEFMRARGIRCGTLAVMKDGRLVLSRGYGYSRPDGSQPVAADAVLRLGSITKPITAAAIRQLIQAGKLGADTLVFDLLGALPLPGRAVDPRLKKITVRHLLEHRAGWDHEVGPLLDPMFQPGMIARALGKPGPPTASDVVRYMVGRPLQFDPGRKTVYSNFGYCVLGRVIEKVSGRTYTDHVRESVLAPLGVESIDRGRTLVADRDPREPWYSDPATVANVMTGEGTVAFPDGGFHLEAMDAHGGLIGSAPDVARAYRALGVNGPRRWGKPERRVYFGRLPGTWTMVLQREDGLTIVALFNQGTGPSGLRFEAIEGALDRAANEVKRWP